MRWERRRRSAVCVPISVNGPVLAWLRLLAVAALGCSCPPVMPYVAKRGAAGRLVYLAPQPHCRPAVLC